MGDSNLSARGKRFPNPRLRTGHSIRQEQYVRWLAQQLEELGTRISLRTRTTRNSSREHPIINLKTQSLPALQPFYQAFYPQGKKVVPRELLFQFMGPLGLAVWYMDDGNYNSRKRDSRLSTESFTNEENDWLAEEFFPRQFNLYPSRLLSNRLKTYSYLKFTVPETRKLVDVVRPHMHPMMRYKLNE